MAGIQTGGNIGGVQQTQGLDASKIHDKKLSIGDLSMLIFMEKSTLLDKEIRNQVGIVHKKNEQMKMLSDIQAKMMNQKTTTQAVSENTWSVNHDKDPKEIALDNGYKIQIHGEKESWTIVDANGNNTKIWGDPHVNEGDRKGSKQWDFQKDATFVLDDGTKITCKCKDKGRKDKNIFSDELIITKANQSIHVTGIADNNPQIDGPALDGAAKDAAFNDGYLFKMGDQVDDWLFNGEEITGDFKNVTEGKGELINEHATAQSANDNLNNSLSTEERNLLNELGITVYDASGVGILTPEEINNLSEQIKNAKETLTSMSQLDMVKLQSLTGKYEQTNSLASQIQKQALNQAKEIIRNIA
ncbi:DUF1521 domain-containing protein [Parendozoicomonas haliclonae]|uniref:DUF1521 domain-containing protein n=1 Tax=Parendozoicomonas haliclonae TaxID=1960125 RepID=A0A1X7AQS0_9GAMM|nr:DUF1521 domain-containing protein [Parendozoicomonas haliclonae]SMA50439.1 hypothetical protein EHSB41UT_04237 [Parendozoicomonas haliclonae]